jgi:RNA polymerase sigma-70 factor, ECF subfamily
MGGFPVVRVTRRRPPASTAARRVTCGDGPVLSEIDRNLIERCLSRKDKSWEEFVDRFLGLVVHVINHTSQARSLRLGPEEREDLCAEVFLTIVKDDLALLRKFRGQSSLATYLSVVARRVVVRSVLQRQAAAAPLSEAVAQRQPAAVAAGGGSSHREAEEQIDDKDEVERLLEELQGDEARVVRMFHLEGRSYSEISQAVGMPENSIGPMLSRARDKMRRAADQARSN